ncbi:MAG TPA: glycine cleavage system protein GcvH [Blastocatellia bacterium]|nr:glycine cleavage system protein GcvH [Blastocatellia bacterium]
MAKYPDNLQYSKDHEWLKIEGDTGRAGITDFAQNSLGDIVYVELPKVGDKFEQGDPFGSVESVKSVNELFIPVSGEIIEVNEALADAPEQVNEDPYGKGWMIRFKITDPSEVDSLLSASEYEDFVAEQED